MQPISPDPAILDLANLHEAFEGDTDGISEILEMAVDTSSTSLGTLDAAIAAGDAAAVAKAAHGIKGACANVGGKAVARAFSAIEEPARDGSLVDVSVLYDAAIVALERFTAEVARYRASLG
jgi:two-component system sensor histidine kinase BarA